MTKLGIIAGRGSLPAKIIDHCRREGRPFYVLAFEGQTDPSLVVGVEHGWTRLGSAENSLKLLRAAGATELVMAGGIRRPSLAELQPDRRTAQFFAKMGVRALGDDGILKSVKATLEEEGFHLVGANELVADLLAIEGSYGKVRPDAQAEGDIASGFRVARALGALDVGQATIVQQGLVLGVEAIEGTDALIERCATLRRDGLGGVLVKATKPGQERRMDLPTIGPETVERAADAGLRGIAVEAGGALILDRERLIETANRRGLFVVGRAPSAKPITFFLIAGEPSGDVLGARLMAALRERTSGAATFQGVGGETMAEQGLKSLFPIAGLAVMGIFEVLPKASGVLRRVRQTAAAIEAAKPDAVVTIDSSGFSFRVAERLRHRPNRPLAIHYVAPMVWAWRAHRAREAAQLFDHLLTLLPFEPLYFEQAGLPTTFVGHSAVEERRGDGEAFRARHGLDPDASVLCLLPGSRPGEVRRLLPIMIGTVERLASTRPNLVVVIPTVDIVAELVGTMSRAMSVRHIVVRGAIEKRDAYAASRAALAASGTVALELALARVPMVITYRIAPVAAYLYRLFVKLPAYSLVNILLGRNIVPELLQEDCRPDILEPAVAALLIDGDSRKVQLDAFDVALKAIGFGGEKPSLRAADKILELVKARHQPAG